MRQGDCAQCRRWIPNPILHKEGSPMPDIMVLVACLHHCLEPTPLRHLGRVIEAMLSMSGRVTMRGLSRWSGKGGSYRTIQRFFTTSLHWCHLQWLLIRQHWLGACPRKKSLKNNAFKLRRDDFKISHFLETRVLTGGQNFCTFLKNL